MWYSECSIRLRFLPKAGQANQEYRKKQEMRLNFKYETVSPSGLNQDFIVLRELLVFHLLARWHAQPRVSRARARLSIRAGELIERTF